MINWGIIGYGRIASRFEKGLSYSHNGKLYAIGTKSKYEEARLSHPNIKIYKDYVQLINDRNIDAVYIALPHQLHYEWSKKALINHKAVLVEKPSTLSYAHILELCDISKNNHVFFMEAMKSRFIPMINELKELLNNGIIGQIKVIETAFCYNMPYNDQSYIYDKNQGGALYDVGIYNIAMILDLIHLPVLDMKVEYEKKYNVDVYDKVTLIFDGCQAILEMATARDYKTSMVITGDKGTITCSPFYRPTEIMVSYKNDKIETYKKPYIYDDFYGEIEEVHQGIKEKQYESHRYSHHDMIQGIQIMKMIKEKIK